MGKALDNSSHVPCDIWTVWIDLPKAEHKKGRYVLYNNPASEKSAWEQTAGVISFS